MTTSEAITILGTLRDNKSAEVTKLTQEMAAVEIAIAQLQGLLNTPPADLAAAQEALAQKEDTIAQLASEKEALEAAKETLEAQVAEIPTLIAEATAPLEAAIAEKETLLAEKEARVVELEAAAQPATGEANIDPATAEEVTP